MEAQGLIDESLKTQGDSDGCGKAEWRCTQVRIIGFLERQGYSEDYSKAVWVEV